MYHLLYIDIINHEIVPISNPKQITVHIESNKPTDKDIYFSILFNNLRYTCANYFIFNIYKKTSKNLLSTASYVDKDIVYLYEDKTKAKKLIWEEINNIWINVYNNKKISITNKNVLYFDIPFLELYKKLNKTKDITKLVKDINYINKLEQNEKSITNLPETISQELEN